MGRLRKRPKPGAAPDRWERLRGWLKQRQGLVRHAVWWLACAYFLLFLWVAGGLVRQARELRRLDADARQFARPAPLGRGRSQPEYRQATDDTEATDTADEGMPPIVFRWRERVRLRQAAARLAEAGDLAGAISLLLQDPEVDAAASEISQLAYDRLVLRLQALWPDETARLLAFLAEHSGAAVDLADPAAAARTLPPGPLFCLIHNLHVDLQAAERAPRQLVELLLDSRFREAGLARELYLGSQPRERREYAGHAELFNAAFDRQFLSPLGRELLLELRGNILAGGDAVQGWFAGLVGDETFRAFMALTPDQETAAVEALWAGLPEPARRAWSRRLLHRWERGRPTPLPPEIVAANRWFEPTREPVTGGFFLLAIRRHPVWQYALRGFDYDEAARQTSRICHQLLIPEYTLPLQVLLAQPLESEKARFAGARDDWRLLARQLDIDAALPPLVDRDRRRWRQLTPRQVIQAMQTLAAGQDEPRRTRMQTLIGLYALNRGFREDPTEDRELTPAPEPPGD